MADVRACVAGATSDGVALVAGRFSTVVASTEPPKVTSALTFAMGAFTATAGSTPTGEGAIATASIAKSEVTPLLLSSCVGASNELVAFSIAGVSVAEGSGATTASGTKSLEGTCS